MRTTRQALAAAALASVLLAGAAAAQNGTLVCPYQTKLVLVAGNGEAVTVQGKGDVAVRAGTYRIRSGELRAVKEGKTWRFMFQGGGQLKIVGGRRVNCPVGPTLTLKATVTEVGQDMLTLGLVITGRAGERYVDVKVNDGAPPDAAWKIVTGNGAVKAKGAYHYG